MTSRRMGYARRAAAGLLCAGVALASAGCGRGWGPAVYGGLVAFATLTQMAADAAQAAAADRAAEDAEEARMTRHAPVCDRSPQYPWLPDP